jgi:tRNA-2-methylthio-N6-dimethylallyladenosine synthase
MSRKYSREHYLELVKKIKQAITDVVLTTDIIVGFPGETDEQFEDTIALYEEVQFASAFTFIYSAREGTPAANMVDDVPESVKKQRLHRLNDVVSKFSLIDNQKYQDQVLEVLVEGVSKANKEMLSGRSRTNKLIHFKGDASLTGQFVHVKITDVQTFLLKGELVANTSLQDQFQGVN